MLNLGQKVTLPQVPEVRPQRALVSYSDGTVSCHNVSRNDDKKFYLQAGVIADNRALRRFGERLVRGSKKQRGGRGLGFIREQILYEGASGLTAWVSCRREARLWLQVGATTRMLGPVPLPPLVFVANPQAPSEDAWRCFALTGRLAGADTRLAHAPFWNLYEWGAFCFGNAALPGAGDVVSLADLEAPMFESKFTHVNHNNTIKSSKDGVGTMDLWKFWKGLESEKQFPKRSLVPRAGMTLGNIIHRLEDVEER